MIEFPEERQEFDDRLFELLSQAIPPARDNVFMASTIREDIERTIAELRTGRPTWVVPPGLTVDWSIPVDVVESPWPSDYVYVLPAERDPWE